MKIHSFCSTWLVLGFMSLLVGGCASSGTVRDVSTGSGGISVSHDNVLVVTTCVPADPSSHSRLLAALVISGLQTSGRFANVTDNAKVPAPPTGIKVAVNVEKMFGVSDAERQLVGAFAGRADIEAQVVVYDLKTGAQLQSFDAQGKSSGGSIFAGTTDQAVQRCADQVVAEVLKIAE